MANMNRIYDRFRKIRKRPYYNKNHKVKSKKGERQSGYHARKRRKNWTNYRNWRHVEKQMTVSPELRAILHVQQASWGQIVKGIWRYIKDHRLQVAGNGRNFIPDKTLATVIGKEGEEMNGFRMMTYLKNHIVKAPAPAPTPAPPAAPNHFRGYL